MHIMPMVILDGKTFTCYTTAKKVFLMDNKHQDFVIIIKLRGQLPIFHPIITSIFNSH